jgi:hypothetical protein
LSIRIALKADLSRINCRNYINLRCTARDAILRDFLVIGERRKTFGKVKLGVLGFILQPNLRFLGVSGVVSVNQDENSTGKIVFSLLPEVSSIGSNDFEC